jgi:hypothetical protein
MKMKLEEQRKPVEVLVNVRKSTAIGLHHNKVFEFESPLIPETFVDTFNNKYGDDWDLGNCAKCYSRGMFKLKNCNHSYYIEVKL